MIEEYDLSIIVKAKSLKFVYSKLYRTFGATTTQCFVWRNVEVFAPGGADGKN